MLDLSGCCCKLGALSVGVLIRRSLLFGAYIWALIFWKLPCVQELLALDVAPFESRQPAWSRVQGFVDGVTGVPLTTKTICFVDEPQSLYRGL